MEKLTFYEYWWDVVRESSGRAWESTWMKGIILALGILALALVGFSVLLANSIITLASFKDSVIATSVFQVATVCCYGGIVILLFLSFVFRRPLEIHNDQVDQISARDKQIDDLKNMYEAEPLEIPLRIEEFNDPVTQHRIGISITNPSPSQDISDLSVELKSLIWRHQIESEIVIPADNLQFPYGDDANPSTILAGRTRTIYIAEVMLNLDIEFKLQRSYIFNVGADIRFANFEIDLIIRARLGTDRRVIRHHEFKRTISYQRRPPILRLGLGY